MDILKFINSQMEYLKLNYEFGEWTSEIKYPYFVGELLTPEDYVNEDGGEEYELLITGWNKGSAIELELKKKIIKKHFDPIYGLRKQISAGSVAAFYAGVVYPPTGVQGLKKIEIRIQIKHWKGGI